MVIEPDIPVVDGHWAVDAPRFAATLAAAPVGMLISDADDGTLLTVNQALCELTGYSPPELAGGAWRQVGYAEDVDAYDALRTAAVANGRQRFGMEVRFAHARGELVWAALSFTVLRDAAGAPRYFLGVVYDLTEQKRVEQLLREQALTDALTGLANRAAFYDHLQLALQRRARRDRGVGVVYVDVNGLKEINDRYGHAVGDRVLVEAGSRMRRAVRPADTVARLGGDEFAVVGEDLHNAEELDALVERVRERACRPLTVGAGTVNVSVAAGAVYAGPREDTSVDALLAAADAAMYAVKTARRWQRSRGPSGDTSPEPNETDLVEPYHRCCRRSTTVGRRPGDSEGYHGA
jgi:diguanylate cyclase (GGDEF)-like protein/PAS domain S-box-containing protein